MANILNQGQRRSFLAILGVGDNFVSRRASNWLDASKFVAGENGQKEIYPGLVVAQNTATYKWVPYNSSASYGPGSDGVDSVLGVMDTFEDVSWGDQAIAPVFHGKVIERHCYVFGQPIGTIAGAVKTALPDLEWIG
jgi:hypothetical protein